MERKIKLKPEICQIQNKSMKDKDDSFEEINSAELDSQEGQKLLKFPLSPKNKMIEHSISVKEHPIITPNM